MSGLASKIKPLNDAKTQEVH